MNRQTTGTGRIRYLLTLLLLVPLPATAWAGDTILAGNANTIRQMSPQQARDFYLGERVFLGDLRVTPVIYVHHNPEQERFFLSVLKMKENRYRSYWIRKLFRGEGTPPIEADSPDDMLRRLATTPGAIGFIPADKLAGHPGIARLFTVP